MVAFTRLTGRDLPRPLLSRRTMTRTLAMIERAKRTPARIVKIEWTRRGTAYRNMMKRYSAKAALERQLEHPGKARHDGR